MKLNYDCIRDILIYLENTLRYNDMLEFPSVDLEELCAEYPNYSKQDICYSLQMMNEAGLIKTVSAASANRIVNISCRSLTFEGHKYLEEVRNPRIWNSIKATFKNKALELAMDAIPVVAKQLIISQLDS